MFSKSGGGGAAKDMRERERELSVHNPSAFTHSAEFLLPFYFLPPQFSLISF